MKRITHLDIRGRYGYGIAYNVKVHHLDDGGIPATDGQRERAYNSAQRIWWADAEALAGACGFSGVVCAGRMDGYIAPLWDEQPVGPDLFTWYGEGEFQDDFNAAMEGRLARFEAGIESLLAGARQLYRDELQSLVEEDIAEANEAAMAAATRAECFKNAVQFLKDHGREAAAEVLASYA